MTEETLEQKRDLHDRIRADITFLSDDLLEGRDVGSPGHEIAARFVAQRFAALGLLIMTAMISVYVMPQDLLTAHVYWAGILTVLLSLGAGQISVDHIIRYIARR